MDSWDMMSSMMDGWGMGGKGMGGKGMGGKGKQAAVGHKKPTDPKKMFVGGLPKVPPSEASITEYFSQFGEISDVKMMTNEDGSSKGYCFVTFVDEASAEAVYKNHENNMV